MRVAWLVIPAIAVAATGCGGGTKAGGHGHQTVVLTLANHERGGEDLGEYVAAVGRLSGGSIRLDLREQWRPGQVDYDRGTVADVRSGKVDLGKIAVRSLDTLGVDDFQALMAPFLVDSLSVEEEVLASDLPARMVPAAGRLGVDGVAMLPGPLRRPLGLTRRLVAPTDYRDAEIGIRPSLVSTLTFRVLGAFPSGYVPGELPPWRFDGAELDPYTVDGNHYAVHGSSLTANVVFWPRAVAIVGNRQVLAQLTPGQRKVLREAGREALGPAIERLRGEDAEEASVLCRRDRLALVEATPSQLAALRAAVRPVYAKLEQNPKTRSLISEIETLKQHSSEAEATTLRCAGASPRTVAATPLDGTWEMTLTHARLVKATHDPVAADVDAGHYRMVLDRGRVSIAPWNGTGVYTVRGDTVALRFRDGETALYRWNVYRNTLTLRYVPGRKQGIVHMTLVPWHRAGS
jgi:TRAP-type C4-dicarboxylate transport system substrate-binding protein